MKTKTRKIQIHTCEKCGEEFQNTDSCIKHENSCKEVTGKDIIGNWLLPIKEIPSSRLMKIIYNGGTNERCTYWHRWYHPSGIGPDGSVSSESKDSSYSGYAGILTLRCRLDRLIEVYNAKGTKQIERTFIRHFALAYMMEEIDTRSDRFHNTFIYNLCFFYSEGSNSTNCSGRIMERLFTIWYVMNRMGVDWEVTVNSVKAYARTCNHYLRRMGAIQSYVRSLNAKRRQYLVDSYEMPEFEEIRDLCVEDFSDGVIDWLFDEFFMKGKRTVNPKYCGIMELGECWVYPISKDTLYNTNTKKRFKIGPGVFPVPEVWIDYLVTTWTTAKSIHEGFRDIPVSQSHNYQALVECNTSVKKLKPGDMVMTVKREDGIFQSYSQPWKWDPNEKVSSPYFIVRVLKESK